MATLPWGAFTLRLQPLPQLAAHLQPRPCERAHERHQDLPPAVQDRLPVRVHIGALPGVEAGGVGDPHLERGVDAGLRLNAELHEVARLGKVEQAAAAAAPRLDDVKHDAADHREVVAPLVPARVERGPGFENGGGLGLTVGRVRTEGFWVPKWTRFRFKNRGSSGLGMEGLWL